jgi:DNA-binding CsgD family transcriptional regulator
MVSRSLIEAARVLAPAVSSIDSPAEILSCLHELIGPFGLSVCAVWALPRLAERAANYVLGVSVFPGPSAACRAFCEQWMRDGNGPSLVALMARRTSAPVLLSEAMRRLKLRTQDPIVKLYRAHGFSDAVYIPARQWMALITSPRVLRPSPLDLYLLGMLVHIAIARIDELKGKAFARLRAQQWAGPALTERETSALELRSHGYQLAEIAHQLGVSRDTAADYLKRAKTKLQAKDLTHTACTAIRLRMIE